LHDVVEGLLLRQSEKEPGMREMIDPIAAHGLGWVGVVIGLILILACEAGYRIGEWQARRKGQRETAHVGTLTAGMLGLLAFILGLAISIAEERFEARRHLVVDEAKAIGTSRLRAQVVAGEEGAAIQRLLADYTRLRIAYTIDDASDREERKLLARSQALQAEIWALAAAVARREPTTVSVALLAVLNDTFDAAMAQRYAYESRVPSHIMWLLLIGAVLSIGALGFQFGVAGRRHAVLSSFLIGMWAGGMLLIIDLNRPTAGFIRPDASPLIWTLAEFGLPP